MESLLFYETEIRIQYGRPSSVPVSEGWSGPQKMLEGRGMVHGAIMAIVTYFPSCFLNLKNAICVHNEKGWSTEEYRLSAKSSCCPFSSCLPSPGFPVIQPVQSPTIGTSLHTQPMFCTPVCPSLFFGADGSISIFLSPCVFIDYVVPWLEDVLFVANHRWSEYPVFVSWCDFVWRINS